RSGGNTTDGTRMRSGITSAAVPGRWWRRDTSRFGAVRQTQLGCGLLVSVGDDPMSTLEFHPLADIFPLVEGAEFDELVADINEHGLHEPIVVYEDKILDGRNRYRACEAAGIEPTFTVYQGDDPVSYVISLNLRRRHLDESQRAMVAAKLATLKLGDNQHSEGLPIGRSSELLNVGERTVARAREVQEHGTPELVSAVERGAVS